MKQPDPTPLLGIDSKSSPKSPCRPEYGPKHGEDFPAHLAEALDILVDRARRHGLGEVAHLLEVAALAARDAAALSADRPCQPERKRDASSSAVA